MNTVVLVFILIFSAVVYFKIGQVIYQAWKERKQMKMQ
jgi:hypothetical protein